MKIVLPVDRQSYWKEVSIILAAFVLSRILSILFGIQFQFDTLYRYWQFLNTETLKNDLLRGLWFDHSQPPFFNLVLGVVLKISGNFAPVVFNFLLLCISLINCSVLLAILRRLIPQSYVPLGVVLLYLLSPGLIIFESELFYTTFISMLLLTSAYFILQLQSRAPASAAPDGKDLSKGARPWKYAMGIFLPITILCLTRSMYHLVWLVAVSVCLLFVFKKSIAFKSLLTGSLLSLLLVSGWYVKNYVIFGEFSTSSWLGMNLSRLVYHDHEVTDSSKITSISAFSAVSTYRNFIDTQYRKKYAGLDDRDLLWEYKDTLYNRNFNNIAYLDISKQYLADCKTYIKQHPGYYISNVFQSFLTFFAPATRYPLAELEVPKIKYYDMVYSLNFAHLAKGKEQRRIALMASAFPKILIYLCVFYLLGMDFYRRKKISPLNLFIICTICYVFFTSSLVEHYENMRFRYEIEPLFLVLLGQALMLAKPFKTIFNR